VGIILKPWFAVVVLVAAVGVWAFTIGPLGAWHEHTTSTRLDLRGDTYQRQTATSPAFSLSGGPTTLKISAAPSAGASLIADVSWKLIPTPPRGAPPRGGNEGLMSPKLEAGPYNLANDLGVDPSGGFRLRISATSDSAASITATVTQQGGYWRGIPVFWIVLLAGIVYIGITVVLMRRQYAANPAVVGRLHQRHELE
jgi:hypothetical protein